MSSTEAEEYVKLLMTKGAETPCEENGKIEIEMPVWADEERMKRGGILGFYNLYAMTLITWIGLTAGFAISSILRILISTKKSSDPAAAYKRYKMNALHGAIWSKGNFRPGSESWKSLERVRKIHLNKSRSSQFKGIGIISQKDLTLTMFGFMGLFVSDPDEFGIKATDEQMEDFVHNWRVMGHLLGCKEEFNLCGETLKITRDRINLIKQEVIRPALLKAGNEYYDYMKSAITGIQCFTPHLSYDTAMFYVNRVLKIPNYYYFESDKRMENESNKEILSKLGWLSRLHLFMTAFMFKYVLKVTILRWIANISILIVMLFLEIFPVIAIYRFGVKNAYVKLEPARKHE